MCQAIVSLGPQIEGSPTPALEIDTRSDRLLDLWQSLGDVQGGMGQAMGQSILGSNGRTEMSGIIYYIIYYILYYIYMINDD